MWRSIVFGAVGCLLVAGTAQAQVDSGQPAVQQPGDAGKLGSGLYSRGYYARPWYGEPGIRQQLKLTDEQYNRMTQAYDPSYQRLNQAINNSKVSTEQERRAIMNEAYSGFYRDQSNAYKDILTPEQQSRYNQLWNQYRGYDALLDPTTRQKLNLTDKQIQQLQKYDAEYQQQFGSLHNTYTQNRDNAVNSYNQMWPQVSTRIGQVLTPDQQRQWAEVTGTQYRFQPFYGYTPGPAAGTK
jgi:Spy/CpxP family protein refolding chaperone